MSLNLLEYEDKACSTCLDSCWNADYLIHGLVAEVGELNGKIAKKIRGDHEDEDPQEYKERLLAELGDILWFTAVLSRYLGSSLEEVAENNLKKLASRKVRGVIQGDGDDR